MDTEETKTYLILQYGSLHNAYIKWQTNNCHSNYDNILISKLISFNINEILDKQ